MGPFYARVWLFSVSSFAVPFFHFQTYSRRLQSHRCRWHRRQKGDWEGWKSIERKPIFISLLLGFVPLTNTVWVRWIAWASATRRRPSFQYMKGKTAWCVDGHCKRKNSPQIVIVSNPENPLLTKESMWMNFVDSDAIFLGNPRAFTLLMNHSTRKNKKCKVPDTAAVKRSSRSCFHVFVLILITFCRDNSSLMTTIPT